MFSSGAAITAISVPTGDASPSAATSLRTTPSPRATSSITALSVSTSARTSPVFTASPSCFSHLTRRPSSIVGESASITTFVAIAPSVDVHDLLHCRDCLRRVRLRRLLEILSVRHRSIGLMYSQNRRIQIVEAFALDEIDHLAADAADLPAFLENYGTVRFPNRRVD